MRDGGDIVVIEEADLSVNEEWKIYNPRTITQLHEQILEFSVFLKIKAG